MCIIIRRRLHRLAVHDGAGGPCEAAMFARDHKFSPTFFLQPPHRASLAVRVLQGAD